MIVCIGSSKDHSVADIISRVFFSRGNSLCKCLTSWTNSPGCHFIMNRVDKVDKDYLNPSRVNIDNQDKNCKFVKKQSHYAWFTCFKFFRAK